MQWYDYGDNIMVLEIYIYLHGVITHADYVIVMRGDGSVVMNWTKQSPWRESFLSPCSFPLIIGGANHSSKGEVPTIDII